MRGRDHLMGLLPWIVAAGLLPACVTTAYQGPQRPRAESAILSPVDARVEEIDGNDAAALGTRRLRFSLPPGPHVVWLRLHKVSPWFGTPTLISGHTEICLQARAGARYAMKGLVEKGAAAWKLVVLDGRTAVDTDCNRERLFPGTAAASAPLAPMPTAGAPPSTRAGAQTIALELPPPSPAPLPPSGAREVVAHWRGQPLWRPPARPWLEVTFDAGGAFATVPGNMAPSSDAVMFHDTLEITTRVGLMLTPLWLLTDRLGLGVGSDLELKNGGTVPSDASLAFWRMPATATAHGLIRTHDDWFLLLAGGIESQPIAHVTSTAGSAAVRGSFSSQLGWVARVGAYRRLSDLLALVMGLGYSHLEYEGTDASRITAWLGLHVGVQRSARASDVPVVPVGP